MPRTPHDKVIPSRMTNLARKPARVDGAEFNLPLWHAQRLHQGQNRGVEGRKPVPCEGLREGGTGLICRCTKRYGGAADPARTIPRGFQCAANRARLAAWNARRQDRPSSSCAAERHGEGWCAGTACTACRWPSYPSSSDAVPTHRTTCCARSVYVDKILRGAKPSELPVEQATKLEIVINLKLRRPSASSSRHRCLPALTIN